MVKVRDTFPLLPLLPPPRPVAFQAEVRQLRHAPGHDPA
jgi:hypothetical protein